MMIQQALDAAATTPAELADEAGISYDTLYAWRTGRRNPSRANRRRLADVLERRSDALRELADELRNADGR